MTTYFDMGKNMKEPEKVMVLPKTPVSRRTKEDLKVIEHYTNLMYDLTGLHQRKKL